MGEAWFVEETRWNWTPESLRKVCHFRHEGLKLGLPGSASSSETNTYSDGRQVRSGDLLGSSLGGYVTKGKRSNSRCTGPGIAGIHLDLDLGVDRDFGCGSVIVVRRLVVCSKRCFPS